MCAYFAVTRLFSTVGPRLPDVGQPDRRGCVPAGPPVVRDWSRRPNQSVRAAPPCSPRLRNIRWGAVAQSRRSAASRGMPERSATAGTRPPTYSRSTATPCTRIRAGDHRARALLGAQPRSMAMPRGSSTAVNRPIQHHRKTATSHSLSASSVRSPPSRTVHRHCRNPEVSARPECTGSAARHRAERGGFCLANATTGLSSCPRPRPGPQESVRHRHSRAAHGGSRHWRGDSSRPRTYRGSTW